MKVFFVGTVLFSKLCLEKLIALNVDIVGVTTKSKSAFNTDFASLSELCCDNNIPYKYVKDINAPHILEWISSLTPDIIFVFGWSSLIKKELLNLPTMGVVGFHPANLPANRGRHPIIWALALGLSETASTFFFMDEGADSGDILSQEKVAISYEDNAKTLYEKITKTALIQIETFVPQLQFNNFNTIAQNQTKANNWRKRGRSDGQIDFRMSSNAIYNLVRALTHPYVGAHIFYNEQDVKVWKVREVENVKKNIEPGKILKTSETTFVVKSYDGAIEVLEHDFSEIPHLNSYL